MRKIILLFLLCICYVQVFCQKDSTYLKKNRLPYNKYKGLKLLYISFTPSISFSTPEFDYGFSLTSSPTFAYYFSNKIEAIASYGFTFIKYGSLSTVNAEGFNQFSVAAHYYPLKNINFLYVEGGLQYGNYFTEKGTDILRKEWNLASMTGIGIEVITRKGIIINFNAALVIPFNSKYNYDFARSAGIGFQLDKKRK